MRLAAIRFLRRLLRLLGDRSDFELRARALGLLRYPQSIGSQRSIEVAIDRILPVGITASYAWYEVTMYGRRTTLLSVYMGHGRTNVEAV